MSNKVNIGVIGCANIAERFVIPAINEMDCYNLVGVASRTELKADNFAKKFKTKAYYGYEDLLSASLDAVYIPLPNSMHYEWIKKAINKNVHVLVEKSMACTLEDVMELNSLAQQKNIVIVENFQFRFHSQLEQIVKLIEGGTIGSLRNIRSAFGFPPFMDENNIRYQKTLGGGALLDAGAYPLKISQMFLGDDIYVDSASLHISKQFDVDTWGSAFIKQKNGDLTSQVAFGFDHFYQNMIELWGSHGKITANRIFTAAPGFEPTVNIESKKGSEVVKLSQDHHFKNMLNHFYNLIENNKNLDEEYRQNITQARLINELKEKAYAK